MRDGGVTLAEHEPFDTIALKAVTCAEHGSVNVYVCVGGGGGVRGGGGGGTVSGCGWVSSADRKLNEKRA
jgi:hypothetical protein